MGNKVHAVCKKCGNEWDYKSRKGPSIPDAGRWVTCPKCSAKTKLVQK